MDQASTRELSLKYSTATKLAIVSSFSWLFVSMAAATLASLKLHAGLFLSESAVLNYGSLDAIHFETLIYGFCLNLITVWGLADRDRRGSHPGMVALAGVVFWNFFLSLGVVELLFHGTAGARLLNFSGAVNLGLMLGFLFANYRAVCGFMRTAESPLTVSHLYGMVAPLSFLASFFVAHTLYNASGVEGVGLGLALHWFNHVVLFVSIPCLALAAIFRRAEQVGGQKKMNSNFPTLLLWILLFFGSFGGVPHGFPIGGAVASLATVSGWFVAIAFLYFVFLAVPAYSKLEMRGANWLIVAVALLAAPIILDALLSTRPFAARADFSGIGLALDYLLALGAVGIVALTLSKEIGSSRVSPQIPGLKRLTAGCALLVLGFLGYGALDADFFLRIPILGVATLACLGVSFTLSWFREMIRDCCQPETIPGAVGAK